MAREQYRLSATAVSKSKRPGYYPDGGGLYLQISASGTKSWLFNFTLRGKSREMGLGPLNAVSLALARNKATECRGLLVEGIDPIEARNTRRSNDMEQRAKTVSFAFCAASFIAANSAGWKNVKHGEQWTNTIETFCGPVFGQLPVQNIDTALIVKVLEPIWVKKPETAIRLRARIERILDWAAVSGYRAGENPARWRGHLDKILPSLPKKSRVKHHAALPYEAVHAFVELLRAQPGTAARMFEFLILTAARTGEALGAIAEEFDLKKAMWTIPASRMKAGREHRVALSPRALEIVREQLALEAKFVFPGQQKDQPMSNMAMLQLLKRMKREDITVHGFRSSFRDWAAEQTNYPREVAEMALAHVVADQVEAAYRRGDLLEKRRGIMNDWARYCSQRPKGGKVLPMRKAAS